MSRSPGRLLYPHPPHTFGVSENAAFRKLSFREHPLPTI
jgi:hypothetical protein